MERCEAGTSSCHAPIIKEGGTAVKIIEILLQGEHIPDIQLVEVDREKDVTEILAVAAKHRKSEVEGDFLVFIEGSEEPLKRDDHLPESEKGQPLRIHVHRCHKIKVDVTFNGVTKEHSFGPGTTVAAVKKWAAITAFGMNPADAAEHVLQFTGTTNRPEPDTHIGSLATWPDCHLAFDLVPLKRVEG